MSAPVPQVSSASDGVVRDLWRKLSRKTLAAKIFDLSEDGEFDFAHEESVYEAIDNRGVSHDFILRCDGSAMTNAGQGVLILEYCDGGNLATLLATLEGRGETLGEAGWKEMASGRQEMARRWRGDGEAACFRPA